MSDHALLRYCPDLLAYNRRKTREVMVGKVGIGGGHPIRVQSMITSDTRDTPACVAEVLQLAEAGCEIVRITAQTKVYAANLENIAREVRAAGCQVPLVADIHFKPDAALEAARWVEKVRVNPGNYVDKKKFAVREYSDAEYAGEVAKIREEFIPLVELCKSLGRAMRIGTNHGSLSDRIMNYYGDSPLGMVESALEFARIAREFDYHNFVFSMKASKTPISPPSGPSHWLFQGPPAESKLLAAQRRLPTQGARRQKVLIRGEADIARTYATMLDPQCRHVVVSQNLLPHLWQLGVLGGRSFDVLLERWPMEELQRRLDQAKHAHPQSTTLADFRADEDLLRAEREALAAAGRLVTPHLALAAHFGPRAWLIPWEMPAPLPRVAIAGKPTLFFPASRLGRKGAFELADALKSGIGAELRFLGAADEGSADPFVGLDCCRGKVNDLASATALILPAWIEHQPRLALLALASGIPAIATEACGLPPHEKLHVIAAPDASALAAAIRSVLHPSLSTLPTDLQMARFSPEQLKAAGFNDTENESFVAASL